MQGVGAGANQLDGGSGPWRGFSGIDTMGVTYFKRYRMEIRLFRGLFPAPPLPPGYRFVAWRPDLVEIHADTKYRSFCDEIDAHVFPCLGDLAGCHRLMGDISEKPGFIPQATWLVVHEGNPSGPLQHVGTVQGIADNRNCGGIQNLGVTRDHRGLGLGSSLLMKALEGFWEAGLGRAGLEVTAQNALAVTLYRKLGFRRVKTVYKAVEVAYS